MKKSEFQKRKGNAKLCNIKAYAKDLGYSDEFLIQAIAQMYFAKERHYLAWSKLKNLTI